MPVKVRCPSCDKVLNAPDAARGKAIKCPGCQGKISVPAGDGKAGAKPGKAPAKKAAESDDFLDQLDLNAIEDRDVRVCPKCGAELDEGVTECPTCGVDARTGQVTSAFKKKAAMKGPDPILYYKLAWTDSWKFMLANRSLALRTTLYSSVLLAVYMGCTFMVAWSSRVPPKVFWAFMGVAALLAVNGWGWHLCTEVIRGTMGKKDVLNRVTFDIYACLALGVKTAIWSVVFLLPGYVLAFLLMFFFRDASPAVGATVVLVSLLPFLLMAPLAMCHMAMPLTTKGWISPLMFPVLGRTLAPALYWWLVAIVTNVVLIAGIVVGTMMYGATIVATVRAVDAASQAAAQANPNQPAPPAPPEQAEPSNAMNFWVALSIGVGIMLIMILLGSFCNLFNMRSLGLLAYFNTKPLALVTKVEDKAYTVKRRALDKDGKPIKTRGEKIGASLGGAVAIYVISAAVSYAVSGGKVILLPRPLAKIIKLLPAEEQPQGPAGEEQPPGDAAQPPADQQPPPEQQQPSNG